MRIVVASDSEVSALTLKESLLQNKLGTDVHAVPLEQVADRSARFRPSAVILFLPENPERALFVTREILEVAQTSVLVIGSTASAKIILQILQEGASQYIDEDEIEEQLPAALARLSEANSSERKLGRLIAVVGSGGGSGSSTVAANLAAGLAKTYQRCALIDLCIASGDLASILDLEPANTLTDFCRRVDRIDAKMFAQCLCVHPSGIHLLAAPKSYREIDGITARGVRKALGVARSSFDYVVTDLDSPFVSGHSKVLCYADTILVTVRLDFASIRRTTELLRYLEEHNVDRERVQLVATHYGSPKSLRLKDFEQSVGRSVQHFVPHDPRSINWTNNQGTPVVVAKPRASVARSLMAICQSVNGKLMNNNSR